jgi:hypothetical protein
VHAKSYYCRASCARPLAYGQAVSEEIQEGGLTRPALYSLLMSEVPYPLATTICPALSEDADGMLSTFQERAGGCELELKMVRVAQHHARCLSQTTEHFTPSKLSAIEQRWNKPHVAI